MKEIGFQRKEMDEHALSFAENVTGTPLLVEQVADYLIQHHREELRGVGGADGVPGNDGQMGPPGPRGMTGRKGDQGPSINVFEVLNQEDGKEFEQQVWPLLKTKFIAPLLKERLDQMEKEHLILLKRHLDEMERQHLILLKQLQLQLDRLTQQNESKKEKDKLSTNPESNVEHNASVGNVVYMVLPEGSASSDSGLDEDYCST